MSAVLPGTLLALAAALCLYRASPHQQLWGATHRRGGWRAGAGLLLALGMAVTQPALGLAAALGVVSCATMLGCTLLPFVNAWRQARRP